MGIGSHADRGDLPDLVQISGTGAGTALSEETCAVG
jgi:hypothetical protein